MIQPPPISTLFPYTTLFRSILGTYDINAKLFISDKGKYVQIAYIGDNEQVVKNGRAMMVFQVNVEEKAGRTYFPRSEEHTSELQSRRDLVCRLLLEKKKINL